MKFIFFAAKELGEESLNYFISSNTVPEFVFTMKNSLSKKVLKHLESNGIEYIELDKFKDSVPDIVSIIKSKRCNMIISSAFPFILPESILKEVDFPINVHTASLPKYKGFHPISAALLNNDKTQGTTVHFMSTEVDSGDIILQDFIKISNEDTIVSIKSRLIRLSNKLLLLAYKQIRENVFNSRLPIGKSSFAPKRNPEDSRIDFSNTSRYLHNFIRALVDPYPNAFATIKSSGKRVKIKKSIVSNTEGLVLDKTLSGNYVISTRDGIILLDCDLDLEIGDMLC
jgi:methionyl-tRNA formyltransferase